MKKIIDVPNRQYSAIWEREDNIVGKRLYEARKRHSLSMQAAVERLRAYDVTVSKTALQKWEQGLTTPSPYQLLALCELYGIRNIETHFKACYFPDLNDEGEKKVAQYRADLVASGNYKPVYRTEIRYIEMPVSMLAASAGTGAWLDEGNFEMKQFPADSVPAKADFALRIAGDSMEPVYSDGQYVWVQLCNELHPGEVGIFSLDGQGYIKVYSEQEPDDLEVYTDSEGRLHRQPVLVSYNQKYLPIAVTQEQTFRICGRVLK